MKRMLAVATFTVILVLLALAPSASAVDFTNQGTIEAFLGTNLVNVQGYPPNSQVTIEVLRNGVVVGKVTGTTDGTGFVEFNHAGGGQVSEGGDCFSPPATPDIMGGDVIQTKNAAGEITGSAVVRDLSIDFETIDTNTTTNTITVSGHITSTQDAPIVPGADVLELRLNKGNPVNTWEAGPGLDQDRPGRKDLRVDIGGNVQPDGSWTRTLRVSRDDAVDWQNNPGEVFLEWSAAPAGAEEEALPPAIFVADEAGGEAIVGCPLLARYAITDSSHAFVNEFNAGQDMTLSGVAFDADGVSVSVPGGVEHAATLTPTDPSNPNGQQTWTATIPAAELGALPQGEFQASATFTGAGAPTRASTLEILKDTVEPGKPTATPKAGTYERSQSVSLEARGTSEIYFTQNGNRPTTNSRVFRNPIRVTASQTIKAVAFDRAGNQSRVAGFRYAIRRNSFVSLDLRRAKLKLGQREAISGRVFPAHPKSSVKLVIKRNGKVVERTIRPLNRQSRYRFVYEPNRPGRYVVKVRFAGDPDHSASSATKSFRVARRR